MKDNKIYFASDGIEQLFRNGSIIGIVASVHMPWVTGFGLNDNGIEKYGFIWDRCDHKWHNYRIHKALPIQSFIMKDGSCVSAKEMRDRMIEANALASWADDYVTGAEW